MCWPVFSTWLRDIHGLPSLLSAETYCRHEEYVVLQNASAVRMGPMQLTTEIPMTDQDKPDQKHIHGKPLTTSYVN